MVLSKKGTLGKSLYLYAFEGPSHSDAGTLMKQEPAGALGDNSLDAKPRSSWTSAKTSLLSKGRASAGQRSFKSPRLSVCLSPY